MLNLEFIIKFKQPNIRDIRHAHEIEKSNNEVESLKELLSTYEHSIQRKDCVVNDLTKALDKQVIRNTIYKLFPCLNTFIN